MNQGQLAGRIGPFTDPATGQNVGAMVQGTFGYHAHGDPGAVLPRLQSALLGATQSVVQQKLAAGQVALPTLSMSMPHFVPEIIAQSGGATATPPPPAPACSGTAEVEPNDASNQANALAGTACGALATGGDVDWYGWSSAVAGTGYEVALTATGDADILMWKWNGSAWARVQNASPTRIAAATSSAGTYLVAVRSAGGAAQSYALKLTR